MRFSPLFMKPLSILLLGAILAVSAQAVEISKQKNAVSIANKQLRINYDIQRATYSVENLVLGQKVIADARFTVDEVGWQQPDGVEHKWESSDLDDKFGKGKKLSITVTPGGGYSLIKTLHISVYDDLPYAVLGFSVFNQSKIEARIARIGVIDRAKLNPGKTLNDPRLLAGGAGAEPNRVQSEMSCDIFNNLLITGKVDGKRQSIVVGGLHYHEFLRRMVIHPRRKHFSVTIEDPIGKPIAAGDTYHGTDTVFLDVSTANPFDALERYGLAMRKANDANPKIYDFPTLCGWLVSSGHYGEGRKINNSKELVGQMELAVKSGIQNYTPVAIRLEPDYYCNQNYGDTQQGWWNDKYWAKYGSLTEPYETFGKFCGKIREMGGVPFTYIQSNMPSNDFAIAHKEWMMGDDISRLHAEHRHHMPFVKFDFTEPEFQDHVLMTWQRLRKQGLLGIKFDYPESAWIPTGGFADNSYTTTSVYCKLYELCREGLGDESFIHERNLGEYGTPRLDVTAGIVDMQRVWADSSHFEPEMASRMGLRWYKNRSVFGYYPDGKSFKKMDVDQRRTMLSQVGLISGRLELGTSFGRMTKEEQYDLTRLYPIFPGTQSFRPVDMLVEGRSDPAVYSYRVEDGWSQLIFCNNHDEEHAVTAPISGNQADLGSLGHSADASYYLYDFWNDALVGEYTGDQTIEVKLKPHQALTYSLHQKKDHPQFLSTNRHIMQGMVDLDDVKWDADKMTYSGTAKVVGGETFIIQMVGNGFEAMSATADKGVAKLMHSKAGPTKLFLSSEASAEVAWSVSWKK